LVELLHAANIKTMTAQTRAPSSSERDDGDGDGDGNGNGNGDDGRRAMHAPGDSRNRKREQPAAAETGSVDEERPVVRPDDLPEKRFISRLLHAANRGYTHLYHRLEVFSPCRLPKSGPAIIVCNHTSGLDPHLVQSPCRRLITWMMAKEYYDLWFLKPFFEQLGVIPVTRSGRDTSATRAAIRALRNGQLLGIFPEGRIERSRELFPFQTGVALMAMKSGVPVYPAFLDGTQRNKEMLAALLRPQRARVIFGDEVQFDRGDTTRDGLSVATAAIQGAVEALRAEMDKSVARQRL
jgi:1-acyl-sn-glycerol-3-phosphate acyltransferase